MADRKICDGFKVSDTVGKNGSCPMVVKAVQNWLGEREGELVEINCRVVDWKDVSKEVRFEAIIKDNDNNFRIRICHKGIVIGSITNEMAASHDKGYKIYKEKSGWRVLKKVGEDC